MTLPPVDQELVGSLAAQRDARAHPRLGRSLAVHVLVAGDCGGCMMEWALLQHGPWLRVGGLGVGGLGLGLAGVGITIQDSPVGADVLVISGAMTHNLVAPVQRALLAMALPRWVVAIGDCAVDGGVFAGSPAVAGGVQAAIPVDLVVPGCPPAAEAILAAIRALVEVNG